MDAEHWKRIEELLDRCAGLSPTERDEEIARTCGDDEELRSRIERLVAAAQLDDGFLQTPTLDRLPGTAPAEDQPPGSQIGSWRLEHPIGSGGMGTVYLAHRSDGQFEQSVALKLIKRGMDTDDILRRFRNERQVLADLTHPGIARLIDGGATEIGRPYLVMEYVAGQPIDRWCNALELGVDERLQLFSEVCRAVHHAHEHLVVHRDLKPTNILVNDEGAPKLLDFGIAKVLDASGSVRTLDMTSTEGRLMTPEYAAPEQIRGGRVSPATDVYSLGVILYELLTGSRPYRWTTKLRSDLERVICEEEPPRPSSVVGRPDGEEPSGGAPRRARTETRKLRARLAGDLDTIVLKSLRKEPERRYAGAHELLEDIDRALDGRPIHARPDTWHYRMRRYVARNRLFVAAASAVMASLSVGLVLTETSRRALQRERDNVFHLSALQDLEGLRTRADELWPAHPEHVQAYRSWLDDAHRLQRDLDAHRAQLKELRERASSVAESDDQTAPRFDSTENLWWYNQLSQLVTELEAFADPETGLMTGNSHEHGWGIERRLEWATRVGELTVDGSVAVELWDDAIFSIEESVAYDGLSIEPQMGLLPIGCDPESGLWEFAHVQTGEPPVRDADGVLEFTEDSSLVFVLLPGGTFWMGAQSRNPSGRNYDPTAYEQEGPPHEVQLTPFFLSKYEMTQGQWLRFTGRNPSFHSPDNEQLAGLGITLADPVATISWVDSSTVARRLGFALPSEAQWEYAARAGTDTAWWAGDSWESMVGAMNIADRTMKGRESMLELSFEEVFDDGVLIQARVDSFLPNPFGLHCMQGNIIEWCRDRFRPDYYANSPSKDPVCSMPSEAVILRGGSWRKKLAPTRSAGRLFATLRWWGMTPACDRCACSIAEAFAPQVAGVNPVIENRPTRDTEGSASCQERPKTRAACFAGSRKETPRPEIASCRCSTMSFMGSRVISWTISRRPTLSSQLLLCTRPGCA